MLFDRNPTRQFSLKVAVAVAGNACHWPILAVSRPLAASVVAGWGWCPARTRTVSLFGVSEAL